MSNKKIINIVKGDISLAINAGTYTRNTNNYANIEFDTKDKLILLDGVPYSSKPITEVTYSELRNLRNNNQLTPGTFYRITDYNCTTTQENTRSAGHQFDIVLLALSENKLAEEGWAMMHDNIYDVVFNDGKTIKCYILYNEENQSYSLIDCNTKLGGDVPDFLVIVDEMNKTITSEEQEFISSILNRENLPYNYFQNSNLSAWKVWYCLDNDTARFAWADDSVDVSTEESIVGLKPAGSSGPSSPAFYKTYYRNATLDTIENNVNYYAWTWEENINTIAYTLSPIPSINDSLYSITGGGAGAHTTGEKVDTYTPAHEGTGLPNGRGVIYRLIDEWNIDYPCDFKNMQMLVPMDGNGDIVMQNPVTSKYCYVFTDNTSGEPEDLSIEGHAINIKVKPNLIGEANSAMYFSPDTLFYTNINDEQIYLFSNITVGIAAFTIFINRGHAINILDGSTIVMLKSCSNICIGYDSSNIRLDSVVNSTFGSTCQAIQLANEDGLNYGNNGVELATKS